MADTERMTARQYREQYASRAIKSKISLPQPIFTPEVYAQTTGELIIEIEPMGAPRVTRFSRFGNEKVAGAIARYDTLKAKIKSDCEVMGYKLGGIVKVRFELSMPASWSDKKKKQYAQMPHQQRYDIDNLVKSLLDAFGTDDSHVHTIYANKIWAYKGRIVIIR